MGLTNFIFKYGTPGRSAKEIVSVFNNFKINNYDEDWINVFTEIVAYRASVALSTGNKTHSAYSKFTPLSIAEISRADLPAFIVIIFYIESRSFRKNIHNSDFNTLLKVIVDIVRENAKSNYCFTDQYQSDSIIRSFMIIYEEYINIYESEF